MPSPHSRKYATSGSAYNFCDGRVAGSFDTNVRSYNNAGNKSHNGRHPLGKRERQDHSRKIPKWYKPEGTHVWKSRSSPHNDASSTSPISPSTDSMSGGSDSGSKYKVQTNSSHENDRWYGRVKQDNHARKDDLTKKIMDLRAKIEVLENDKERKGRQLSSTKNQVISKHQKLLTAKNEIDELKHQVATLREQVVSVNSGTMEKTRIIAELKEQLMQISKSKSFYQKENEKLTKQLGVGKQLLAQKDKFYRQSVQQFQNWNNQLTQKNCQLNQKNLSLEQSYQKALQTIQTLSNRSQDLKIDIETLQKKYEKLHETEKAKEAQFARLMTKLSGWKVSVAPSAREGSSSEKEDEEIEEDSHPRIIPDECVPGFIFDESNLSKKDRTIKPERTQSDELKYSYRAIPIIPSGSVLKQIFEIGRKLVNQDQMKKRKEVPSKFYPRTIVHPQDGLCSERSFPGSVKKDKPLGDEKVEPWQLPDPEIFSRNVKATVFEKLHVESE